MNISFACDDFMAKNEEAISDFERKKEKRVQLDTRNLVKENFCV